jgi:hypothetical protein
MFLHEHFSTKLIKSFPLKAILIPTFSNRTKAKVMPVSRARGLAALAPSTVRQSRGEGRKAFYGIAKIAKHVPSYVLDLGQDVKSVPEVILELLARKTPVG